MEARSSGAGHGDSRRRAILREVNERIWEITDGSFDGFEALCECASPDCQERVPVGVGEYRQIRARESRLLLAPGHEPAAGEVALGHA